MHAAKQEPGRQRAEKERWDEKERRAGNEVWNTGNQEGKKKEKERKRKKKRKAGAPSGAPAALSHSSETTQVKLHK